MGYTDTPIQVRNVTKTFRIYKDKSHTFKDRVLARKRSQYTLKPVLDDISFDVKKGEALGLIGHNGCGKSTTLKLLNRILYPDRGQIVMNGRISSLIELGAGFHPDMTGRENIYINASIFGLRKKEIDQRLDEIIRFSELEEFIDNPVRTYSSGMYMRLAFAIAINVDADILLVDEILAVGDVNFQKKCFDKLADIKRHGTTIVIVSHSMDQIKSVCDSVIWIDGGHIRKQGSADLVCEEYLLEMRKAAEERAVIEAEERGLEWSGASASLSPEYIGTQVSRYARRDGSLKIRFSHVELQNKEGKRSQHYLFGEPMDIVYSLAQIGHPEEIDFQKSVNIVFNIFRADGILCTAFASDLVLERSLTLPELQSGRLHIAHLEMADGLYIVDAVIADRGGKAYDCLAHLIEFTVDTLKKYGVGMAAMENDWDFRTSPHESS